MEPSQPRITNRVFDLVDEALAHPRQLRYVSLGEPEIPSPRSHGRSKFDCVHWLEMISASKRRISLL